MPPKKNAKGNKDQNAKAKQKQKTRELSDKTFGLKNKNKSSKVQKFVKQVESQANDGLKKRQEALAQRRAEEKKAAELARKEAASLFTPIIQQKVPFGTDPKSVLCAFFKEGMCNKGNKCKFSHDLNIARKGAKRDMYTDSRDKEEEKEKEVEEKQKDTMEDWDEDKLRSVIKSKLGNPKTTTDKVCKFFIDAVENCKYGWFWTCPNGGDACKYKHSLPEGYILKTKEQRRLERLAQDAEKKITLEEFIENERQKLPPKEKLTPISWETFLKWKKEHKLNKLNKKTNINSQGKKILSGKDVILQRFGDKYVDNKPVNDINNPSSTDDNSNDNEEVEDVEDNAEHGTAWDLSEFQKQLKEAEKN
ncbi:translation machinery-associated protein TMA46 ASCRUDRAFT_77491, partial [Ascoidea rubescens DSM 1968]